MSRIFIHIGTHKTGTTSIQTALTLAEGGRFLYPESGRPDDPNLLSPGHHHLSGSAVRELGPKFGFDRPSKAPWNDLRREIEQEQPDISIISAEGFCKATSEDVRRIREYLNGLDVTIVLYLRNYWGYAISLYKQALKMGRTHASFRENTESFIERYDYSSLLEKWSEYFEVELRIFDKAKSDLLNDFATLVGIDGLESGLRKNRAPDDSALRIVRILNRFQSDEDGVGAKLIRRAQSNILARRTPGKYLAEAAALIPGGRIGNDADRRWFARRTSEMRSDFVSRYIDPVDRHFFDVL